MSRVKFFLKPKRTLSAREKAKAAKKEMKRMIEEMIRDQLRTDGVDMTEEAIEVLTNAAADVIR